MPLPRNSSPRAYAWPYIAVLFQVRAIARPAGQVVTKEYVRGLELESFVFRAEKLVISLAETTEIFSAVVKFDTMAAALSYADCQSPSLTTYGVTNLTNSVVQAHFYSPVPELSR